LYLYNSNNGQLLYIYDYQQTYDVLSNTGRISGIYGDIDDIIFYSKSNRVVFFAQERKTLTKYIIKDNNIIEVFIWTVDFSDRFDIKRVICIDDTLYIASDDGYEVIIEPLSIAATEFTKELKEYGLVMSRSQVAKAFPLKEKYQDPKPYYLNSNGNTNKQFHDSLEKWLKQQYPIPSGPLQNIQQQQNPYLPIPQPQQQQQQQSQPNPNQLSRAGTPLGTPRQQSGGSKINKTRKYKGRRYKIRDGSRGGKYIRVSGKKIYI
jgi:hypothetical protein